MYKVKSFTWHKPIESISKDKTKGDEGLLTLANEAKRLMEPYVPMDNGALSRNVRTFVQNGVGIIHYLSPYAHYQWEGKLYVNPKTEKGAFTDGERFLSRPGVYKVPTGKKLSHEGFRHPLATSHWDKAMAKARGQDLAEAFQDFLRK